jgi:TRAP-type C4-dicarboxylate transport system permease small subunit
VSGPRRAATVLRGVLQGIAVALMAALTLVVVVGVVWRRAGAALVWYDEVASILLAWLTFYGAALAALERAHIGLPVLVAALPRVPRLALLALREVCVLGFFAALTWAGWRVIDVLEGTTLVSLPSVPAGLAHSALPLGCALFVAAELATLPGRLREARGAG